MNQRVRFYDPDRYQVPKKASAAVEPNVLGNEDFPSSC